MVQAPAEYDWQKEYRAWRQSQPRVPVREQMKTAEEWARIRPRARMSDVLAVTHEILQRPEIMSGYREFLARRQNPSEKYYNVHGNECAWYDDVRYHMAASRAQEYCQWYRMKRDLNDNQDAYGGIASLVFMIAEGSLDAGDAEAIRTHLRQVGDVFDESAPGDER